MFTRLFILAVFWYALFRFLGRVLRHLGGASGHPAGARATGTGPASDRAAGQDARTRTGATLHGEPPEATSGWGRREVIDVEYEEVKPGSSGH